jgi:hypothetical protein
MGVYFVNRRNKIIYDLDKDYEDSFAGKYGYGLGKEAFFAGIRATLDHPIVKGYINSKYFPREPQ